MPADPDVSAWEVADVLGDPNRRQIFDVVRRTRGSLSRDEVARETGINRRLTTFHLDRLADAGLLDTHYARPEGAGGPGAGRPAKRYTAADVELDLTVPPRHYDLAARLLATAVATAPHDAAVAAETVAFDEGTRIGRLWRVTRRRRRTVERAELVAALRDLGYEPAPRAHEGTRLCNCPFRSAADVAPDLVCRMNHALIRGLLEGMGLDPAQAILDPRPPPDCCVTIGPRQ